MVLFFIPTRFITSLPTPSSKPAPSAATNKPAPSAAIQPALPGAIDKPTLPNASPSKTPSVSTWTIAQRVYHEITHIPQLVARLQHLTALALPRRSNSQNTTLCQCPLCFPPSKNPARQRFSISNTCQRCGIEKPTTPVAKPASAATLLPPQASQKPTTPVAKPTSSVAPMPPQAYQKPTSSVAPMSPQTSQKPTSSVAKLTSAATPLSQAPTTPRVSPPNCQAHLLTKTLPEANTATREITAICLTNTAPPLSLPSVFYYHLQHLKSPFLQWQSLNQRHLLCCPRHRKSPLHQWQSLHQQHFSCRPRHPKSPLHLWDLCNPRLFKSPLHQ